MKKTILVSIMIPVIVNLIILSGLAPAAPQASSNAVDVKKLYPEIAGLYEQAGGEVPFVIVFFERDGKLFGSARGGETTEVVPVGGENPLKFTMTDADSGQVLQIEFARNPEGALGRSIVFTKGMEFLCLKRSAQGNALKLKEEQWKVRGHPLSFPDLSFPAKARAFGSLSSSGKDRVGCGGETNDNRYGRRSSLKTAAQSSEVGTDSARHGWCSIR